MAVLPAATVPTASFSQTSPATCRQADAYVGKLCLPGTPGRHPAILLLGGSEGGDSMARLAGDYATRGYVATSVAYFGLPGLPKTLAFIPVETVGTALETIARRSDVDPERIAIFGISKGGELALLAASTYPQIRAVVADVGSPFAWEDVPAQANAPKESSWTVGGVPVPFVPYSWSFSDAFITASRTHRPLSLRSGYDASMMKNDAEIAPAMFHLEKIAGPVLFLSAGDDKIWNSDEQARIGLSYLQLMHHPFADASHSYHGAGHIFLFATPERPLVDTPYASGISLSLGGSREANVAAGLDAKARIATFLENALGKN